MAIAKVNPNSAPDVAMMFQLAEQYSIASNLLVHQSRGEAWGCGCPHLLVDSFAIELYLKCLHVSDTSDPNWGHDLRKLFDSLPATTKGEIRKAFDRQIQSDVVMRLLPQINPDATIVLDFDRSLSAAADTFDGRRYAYNPPPAKEWYYAHLLRLAIRDIAKLDFKVFRFVLADAGAPPKSSPM